MTEVVECAREFLSILREEDPRAYGEILRLGRGMRLGIRYGPDRLTLTFTGEGRGGEKEGEGVAIMAEQFDESRGLSSSPPPSGGSRLDFRCSVEPELFFQIVDGRVLLSDAVWSRSLDIFGTYENLMKVYRIAELSLMVTRGSPAFSGVLLKLRESSFPKD